MSLEAVFENRKRQGNKNEVTKEKEDEAVREQAGEDQDDYEESYIKPFSALREIICFSREETEDINDLINDLFRNFRLPYDGNRETELWYLGVADSTRPCYPSVFDEYCKPDKNGREFWMWLEDEADRIMNSRQFSVNHRKPMKKNSRFSALCFSTDFEKSLNTVCQKETNQDGALYIFNPIRYLQKVSAHVNIEWATGATDGERLSRSLFRSQTIGKLNSNSVERDYTRYWPYLYGHRPDNVNTNERFFPEEAFYPVMFPFLIRINKKLCFMYNTHLIRDWYMKFIENGGKGLGDGMPGLSLDSICEYYQRRDVQNEIIDNAPPPYGEPFCYKITFTEAEKKEVRRLLCKKK